MTHPTDRPDLSVVMPVYNEEETIPELVRRLTARFDPIQEADERIRPTPAKSG